MNNDWLLPYINEEFGQPKGLVLLMVILQTNKDKVRPLMDDYELNTYVDTLTGAMDVSAVKLREWSLHSGPQESIRRSLNKFPDFFHMGTFIDSTHMKL